MKMSEPSFVKEMFSHGHRALATDCRPVKGGTHNVPCCEHAVDYGTAECRHHPKAEEHDGRHQLGEEDRGVWSLNPKKPSLEHSQNPRGVDGQTIADLLPSTSDSAPRGVATYSPTWYTLWDLYHETKGQPLHRSTLDALTSAHPPAPCSHFHTHVSTCP